MANLILLKSSHASALKRFLHKELPHSISVYGGLNHIMKGNICHLEILVDSWPAVTTAVCRREKQAILGRSNNQMPALPNVCTIFTKKIETLQAILEDAIEWTPGLCINGVPYSHGLVTKRIATSRGLSTKEIPFCQMFVHQSPSRLQNVEGVSISSLDESHAHLVQKHANLASEEHIKFWIQHLPSCCIKDESGQPVSWALLDEFYALRYAFTLPEYRGRGYNPAITIAMMKKVHEMGLPVYLYIKPTNKAVLSVMKATGFIKFSDELFTNQMFGMPDSDQSTDDVVPSML